MTVLILVLMESRVYGDTATTAPQVISLNPCSNGIACILYEVLNEGWEKDVLILVLMESRVYQWKVVVIA